MTQDRRSIDGGTLIVLLALRLIRELLKLILLVAMLDSWHAYDAYVSQRVFAFLRTIGFTELRPGYANKITGGLPLVQSPTPMLTLIGAYLLIVLIGLAFLKSRKQPRQRQEDPRWLKGLVQVRRSVLWLQTAF